MLQLRKGTRSSGFAGLLALVLLALCAGAATAQTSGQSSVVFLIDRSGSMTGTDPQNYAYATANVLLDYVELMDPSVKVGVIEFGNGKATATTGDNMLSAAQARQFLLGQRAAKPEGDTPMALALNNAKNLIATSGGQGSRKLVFLLTDGEATDDKAGMILSKLVPEYKAAGIQIIALGFASADEQALQQISQGTGGQAGRVNTAEELPNKGLQLVIGRAELLRNTVELIIQPPDASGNVTVKAPDGVGRARVWVVPPGGIDPQSVDLNLNEPGGSASQGETYSNGSRVLVWTQRILPVPAGDYQLAGKDLSGAKIFAIGYTNIRIEVQVNNSSQATLYAGQGLPIKARVFNDANEDITSKLTLTGQLSSQGGGTSKGFPLTGGGAVATLPNAPGSYLLQVNTEIGGVVISSDPIVLPVAALGSADIRVTPAHIVFDTLTADNNKAQHRGFDISYQRDEPPPKGVPVPPVRLNFSWNPEPVFGHESLVEAITLRTSDGRDIQIGTTAPKFTLTNGGEKFDLVATYPDPSSPEVRRLRDGTYKGVLIINGDGINQPISIAVDIPVKHPQFQLPKPAAMNFWWDPTTDRTFDLGTVSTNFAAKSTFSLDMSNQLLVGGGTVFADVTLVAPDGLTPVDKGDTTGFDEIPLDNKGKDLRIKVVPKNDVAKDLTGILQPFTYTITSPSIPDSPGKVVSVRTMGPSPGGFSLPILGPFSFYGSAIVSYILGAWFLITAARQFGRVAVQLPRQRDFRQGASFPPTKLPAEFALVRRPDRPDPNQDGADTLQLPIADTAILAPKVLAQITLRRNSITLVDPDPALAIAETPVNNGQTVTGGTLLEVHDTAADSERSKVVWEVTLEGYDATSGLADWTIGKSPYRDTTGALLTRLALRFAVFTAVILLVIRAQWFAHLVYWVDAQSGYWLGKLWIAAFSIFL